MSRRKTERLLSLVVCLLSTRRALTAAQIREAVPGYPDSFAAFKRMFERDKEALRELRAILEVLRQVDEPDPRAPTPGVGQLDALISTTSQAGIRTDLQIHGRPRPLPPTVDLTAYRIVQESLTNVLRHAGPASATVTISYGDRRVEITISDNGDGSAPGSTFSEGAGRGLAGMRERAYAVGGSLEAGAGPDGGFRVSAVLPLTEEQAR